MLSLVYTAVYFRIKGVINPAMVPACVHDYLCEGLLLADGH